MSNLDNKIKQLKEICSEFEINDFQTMISDLIMQISKRNKHPLLKGLLSPMRQLFFIAILNIQSRGKRNEKINYLSKTGIYKWDKILELLIDIEKEYHYLLGFPKNGQETAEDIQKIMVTMPTYMNYFFNGPILFLEQQIERVEKIFDKYEFSIVEKFGITLKEFIAFFDELHNQVNINLQRALRFERKDIQNYISQIKEGEDVKKIILDNPELEPCLNFIINPGYLHRIDIKEIKTTSIDVNKFETIIKLFTFDAENSNSVQYYTDINPLLETPFVKLEDNVYQCLYINQYMEALYLKLFKYCLDSGYQITKSRDNYLESKALDILKSFLPKGTHFYHSYTINGHGYPN